MIKRYLLNNRNVFFSLLICSIILMLPAFINLCFLVNSDTGAYIWSQYHFKFLQDRSRFYSTFLILTNFSITLWFSLIAQGAIVSYGIYLFYRFVFQIQRPFSKTIITNIILVITSTVGWYVSNLSPDIFAAILILFVAIILFSDLPKRHYRNAIFILSVSVAVHNSSLPILLSITALMVIVSIFKRSKQLFKPVLHFSLIGFSVALALCIGNYFNFQRFTLSPGSHVFFTSRLAEMGLLKPYLDQSCLEQPNILCATKDRIQGRQWNFMWDDAIFPHSTMERGWLNDTVVSDYNAAVSGILSNPAYRNDFIKIAWNDFLRQCTFTNINDGLQVMQPTSNVAEAIRRSYLLDKYFFNRGLQQRDLLPFTFINTWLRFFAIMYLILLLRIILLVRKTPLFKNIIGILGLIVFGILVNNLITSVLSTYLGRFSSRVIWLLPFLAIATFFYYLQQKRLSHNQRV